MTTRHHIEFQSTDNRYSEVHKSSDYEEQVQKYLDGGGLAEDVPTLEEWQQATIIQKVYGSGGPGRVRVWKVTREEVSAEEMAELNVADTNV